MQGIRAEELQGSENSESQFPLSDPRVQRRGASIMGEIRYDCRVFRVLLVVLVL